MGFPRTVVSEREGTAPLVASEREGTAPLRESGMQWANDRGKRHCDRTLGGGHGAELAELALRVAMLGVQARSRGVNNSTVLASPDSEAYSN